MNYDTLDDQDVFSLRTYFEKTEFVTDEEGVMWSVKLGKWTGGQWVEEWRRRMYKSPEGNYYESRHEPGDLRLPG